MTSDLADGLYGLLPSEFTAARNAAAKDLDKAARDKIMALKKPTPAAWVVNLLVRQRPDQVDAVLDLGEQLREAQGDLDRDALAELTRQRRQLVGALAKQGVALADVAGQKVSNSVADEVAQTLQAGMSDADAALAVRSGRLVRPLEAIGLSVDLEGAVAGDAPPPARRAKTPAVDELEEKRAEKRRREADAKRELEKAETAHEQAERKVADAVRHRDSVAEQVADAAHRLKTLKADLADAEKQLATAAASRDDAAAAAEKARHEL